MFSFMSGFVVGFGTGVLAREISPALRGKGKKTTKNIMKSAVRTFERGREVVSHLGESAEDIFAEVRFELRKDREKEVKSATESKKSSNRSKSIRSKVVEAKGANARPLKTRTSKKGAAAHVATSKA